MSLDFAINVDPKAFQGNLDEVGDDIVAALATARNMVASMIKSETASDLEAAGFDPGAVDVEVDDNGTITTTVSVPGANLFEDGGTIQGKPLLWIPLSGTDAVGTRAGDYGSKLFSVNRKAGGVPLLFSVKDRAPKYFGIPSVNVPKRLHVAEIQLSVMQNFKDFFNTALGAG